MASRLQIRVRRGLDLPVEGAPRREVGEAPAVRHVGLLGRDYPGLRLGPLVDVGDRVVLGQPVLRDRTDARISCTAPAAGVVAAVHRGERRVLQSLVIRIEGDAQQEFSWYRRSELDDLDRETVTGLLCDAGLWTSLRARPYNGVATPGTVPFAITVTAIDTNPLAPDPLRTIDEAAEDFVDGLRVVARLTDGMVYLCVAPGARVPAPHSPRLIEAEFAGPHPAGLPGTHIHMLCPAGPHRIVWHVGYQDVIAIGRLFTTGRLSTGRVVSLGGPMLQDPRVVRTRLGASLEELLDGSLHAGESRIISGSILGGAAVTDWGAWLGRYDNQVTVLPEGRDREFLGWIVPGTSKFSASNAFLSALRRRIPFRFSTNLNGSPRAMVPIGIYERVMPLDILPTPLLRALLVGDLEAAVSLGALELAEEDLALCSFVCPSKHEFGPVLRSVLDQIRKEG
ncbi:MAG: nqrA [Proteobacteria bacterium]|nr:nqrA [Pseudomonadota bacterium]